MKIRWTQNSIRFRITPTELIALQRNEPLRESLILGGEAVWTAEIVAGAAETGVAFIDNAVRVSLSAKDNAELGEQDREGVYFSDDDFRYFVEKDFPCAHPRAAEALEPETETFAAPPGFAERKNS